MNVGGGHWGFWGNASMNLHDPVMGDTRQDTSVQTLRTHTKSEAQCKQTKGFS